MSTTARFTDKDGDEYKVEYFPSVGLIAVVGGDDMDLSFHAVDGQKVIDGIKAAMLEAALGGTYGSRPVPHNHNTRDIKRPGLCPACDDYALAGATTGAGS